MAIEIALIDGMIIHAVACLLSENLETLIVLEHLLHWNFIGSFIVDTFGLVFSLIVFHLL